MRVLWTRTTLALTTLLIVALLVPPAFAAPGTGALYGTDARGGNLLAIDQTTGAATVVGNMAIGVVPALATDPATGIVYAATGGGNPRLYAVDPATGSATFIGNTGLGFAAVAGMDFSADGTLYAAVNLVGDGGTGADHLATIDPATGLATIIGPFGFCFFPFGPCTIEGIEGIAFDKSGTLWGAHSARGAAGPPGLYRIDRATGAATFVTPILDASLNPPSGGVVSLQFACDGTLYGGTANAIPPGSDGGRLVTITPSTGRFRFVGAVADTGGSSLGALAFENNCNTMTGSATGVGRGAGRAGVSMVGTFLMDRKLDLDTATSVTITSLLDDGLSDVAGLPVTLTAECCNNEDTAYFSTAPGTAPRVTLAIRDRGRGQFTFRIRVSDATYNPSAFCPQPELATRFVIDGHPPVAVLIEQPWLCFGRSNQYLKTPPPR